LNGGDVTSDEELMDQIRRGCQEAADTLFQRYRGPVWQFFRRRVADVGTAEELAQDTFVAVIEGAARYERRGAFRSYLFGIAYNVLLAERRKHAQRAADPLDEEPASPHSLHPDAAIWVREALATLDEDDREILMLREYEQLSYQEIADVRRTPLNTVRSQLFRARMALKDALEARAPQPARRSHVSR
jgi:RNA polymerase sigma-70 factor (ECF subfamily)